MKANFKVPIIDPKKTGEKLKQYRLEAEVSVKDLQIVFGFTNPNSIYRWETGMAVPSTGHLLILAKSFGVTIDQLLSVKWVDPTQVKRYDGLGLNGKKNKDNEEGEDDSLDKKEV